MDMVGRPADRHGDHSIVLCNAAKIFPQPRLHFFAYQRQALFATENDVLEIADIGLGHDGPQAQDMECFRLCMISTEMFRIPNGLCRARWAFVVSLTKYLGLTAQANLCRP